jgi:hypothetical protein
MGGRTILQMTKRLIVPTSAIGESRELLKDIEGAPEVVAIEELL